MMARTINLEYATTLDLYIDATDCDGPEVVAYIDYTFTPGSPAVMYQRNGDPGWPAEPAEVEVTRVTLRADGEKLDCPKWLEQRILTRIDDDTLVEHALEEMEPAI